MTSVRSRVRRHAVDEELFVGRAWNIGEAIFEFTSAEARAVTYALIKHDLIDIEGAPTDKFREECITSALAEFDNELREKAPAIELAVRSVYDASVLNEMVGNGNVQKVARNPLNENFKRKEFKELWERIRPQYAYTVDFDDAELREKAVAEINSKFEVSSLSYTVTEGRQAERADKQSVRNGEGFDRKKTRVEELATGAPTSVTYDLVGEVAKAAGITRKSAADILSKMNAAKFKLFTRNPEEFIAKVGKLIVSQKAAMVVEHISYHPTSVCYDATIFTEAMPESRERAYRAQKNVQDWVFPDGTAKKSVERQFAEDLDAGEEVAVYAKLPRGFTIPTPVGNYAPDWAIAFDKEHVGEKVKHVFFVAETKGSLNTLDLRGDEKAKIECARKLFNEISTHDVRYHHVTTYQELLDAVRGK